MDRPGKPVRMPGKGRFYAGQIIRRAAHGGYIAATETRRDGCAAGF